MVDLDIAESISDRAIYHIDPNRMRRIYIRSEHTKALKDAWRILGEKLGLLSGSAG